MKNIRSAIDASYRSYKWLFARKRSREFLLMQNSVIGLTSPKTMKLRGEIKGDWVVVMIECYSQLHFSRAGSEMGIGGG